MGEHLPPVWLRLLPAAIREKVKHRPNLLQAISNTGWLFGDKVLRMGIGLLVGVWIARYLGPVQFGLLNYAVAVVTLFGAVASVGLNGIVVRDLLNQPEAAQDTLGSSFVLQLLGGLIACGLAVFTISLLRPDDALVKLMVTVLGFALIFKASDVARYWFESQVESRYVVWVENGIFLLLAALKIALVLGGAPLMSFVWIAFAEALLVSVGLLVVYARRGGRLAAWRVRASRIKCLFADSWPLILSGLAVMIYMRIDQIMLGQMLDNKAVGIYSAAVRISEVWYFIPLAIASSAFPAIAAAKQGDEKQYEYLLRRLYQTMLLVSVCVALLIGFSSDWLVAILFGDQYGEAGGALSVLVWAGVFVSLGVASSQALLVNGLQKLSLYRTAIGCVLNVALNLVLIPSYGVVGSAWATLVSYFAATFLVVAFPQGRVVNRHLVRAILFAKGG